MVRYIGIIDLAPDRRQSLQMMAVIGKVLIMIELLEARPYLPE
jgi:hypothetical protein